MLVAVGGIHGNEPAGALALVRVMEQLESHSRLLCGDCVALAGNLPALAARRRFIDEDLNRSFDLEWVESDADSAESREKRELWDALESVFREARGPVVLLDLHTTSGVGAPFAVFADTMVSRNFARRLSIPVVLGLEEQLAGTLIDYVGLEGHVAVGFEGGQHQDPQSVDHLEAIVWIALGELGLVDVEAAWLQAERDKLVRAAAGAPAILEMTYRHAITGENAFSMLPGFASFEPVTAGQTVAVDARGDVTAPKGGYLLMPLYQKQGDDGFFIVTKVRSFWLWLSALLRYARAGRIAHWLPGVSRVEGERHRVRVRRAIARWYSLELLHLLGFRRLAEEGDMLLMERRAHDLP